MESDRADFVNGLLSRAWGEPDISELIQSIGPQTLIIREPCLSPLSAARWRQPGPGPTVQARRALGRHRPPDAILEAIRGDRAVAASVGAKRARMSPAVCGLPRGVLRPVCVPSVGASRHAGASIRPAT